MKRRLIASLGLLTTLPTLALAGGRCGMGGGGGCGALGMIGGFALLVLAALGYWVLTLADKQQKPLSGLGRLVGGLILAVSLLGLLWMAVCGAWCAVKGMGSCNAGAAAPACHTETPAP